MNKYAEEKWKEKEARRRNTILRCVSVLKCLLNNKQSLCVLSCYRTKVRPSFDC